MPALRFLCCSWLMLACAGAVHAQSPAATAVMPIQRAITPASSAHRLVLDGKPVQYTATFLEQALGDPATPAATISATAYVRMPASTTRPVLFVFNGGPGASSSPLHFSGIGPKLQMTGPDGMGSLQDNPDSLLDAADLVFIDPPGTGFSQAPQSELARAQYWSSQGDADAVLLLIKRWRRENGRENSPLYIAGESYGGYRLAIMAAELAELRPAGLLLVSPLLDASASSDAPGNVLPHIFVLPSLAVAAARSRVVADDGRSIPQIFEQARTFALGEYAHALLQGRALPERAREAIAARVAALIGLPAAAVLANDLRIDAETYRNTVLKDRGQVLGRLDSRIVAAAPKPVPGRVSAANDPALGLGASNVIVSSVIGEYLRHDLGVPLQRDYVSLSLDVNGQWHYSPPTIGSPFYFNPTENIAALLTVDPKTKLLVLCGYYDLAVPALAPWYALTHAGITPQRMRYEVLESGHSVFDDAAQRRHLHGMLKEFVE